MSAEQVRIDPKIADHVDAALAAGFTVYATTTNPGTTGWVAVCLDDAGPWAHIQRPTHPWDGVELDVPVTPHKDWGSSVKVDHDGTPKDAVRALRQACSEDMVTVRFMTNHYINKNGGVPIVRNAGRKCISHWEDRITQLGQRGTNWVSKQNALRLDTGDRFIFTPELGGDGSIIEVESRRYAGHAYEDTFVTATDGRTIVLVKGTTVTLAGAA